MRSIDLASLKAKLADVPGIENLSLTNIGGRMVFGWNGGVAAVDPAASDLHIETTIRRTASTRQSFAGAVGSAAVGDALSVTGKPAMTTASSGSFSAALKAIVNDAKAELDQSKADAEAQVRSAVGKIKDAAASTKKVAGNMASRIESEAAEIMADLGQISNDL